jgi:hypothetical protein
MFQFFKNWNLSLKKYQYYYQKELILVRNWLFLNTPVFSIRSITSFSTIERFIGNNLDMSLGVWYIIIKGIILLKSIIVINTRYTSCY